MLFHGIESSKNERFNHKKKLQTWPFEYGLIFSPLIISNSF